MCLNPIHAPDGTVRRCRKCRRCRLNRVNDWVGRSIAESRHATETHSVTLTYGPDAQGNADHIHAALLIYRDVQQYFKRLRKAGFKFKYLVAGEYGTLKRRAHWHVILFWSGAHPPVEMRQNVEHEYWPHGHTFWEHMTPQSIWYVCKYLQKDQADDEAEAMLRMSRKPPLGHEWFQKWARQHVDEGLAPRSLHYTFADVTHKDGALREFYMTGVTADNFLREYCRYYVERKGSVPMHASDLVQDWIDKAYEKYFDNENWMKERGYGSKTFEAFKRQEIERRAIPHGGVAYFLPGINPGAGQRLEPLGCCADGTVIEYAQPSKNRVDEFAKIIAAA